MSKKTFNDVAREKRAVLKTLNSSGGFINKVFAKAKARKYGLVKSNDGTWYDPTNQSSLYSSAFDSDGD